MKDLLLQQVGTPRELYNDPVNLFVAGFIGSPAMNLLPGRLEKGKLYLPMTKEAIDLPGMAQRISRPGPI